MMNTMKMLMQDDVSRNVIDVGEPRSIPQILNQEFANWYVPSIKELQLVYNQRVILKDLLPLSDKYHILWSSTEGSNIWQGHRDSPDGRDYPSGKYFEGYSRIPVKLNGRVTGVNCINFYTGKKISIAKTHDKSFILIRQF